MKKIIHKYIGSFFWAIRNKKRLGGIKVRFTDEGWAICMPDIVLNPTGKEQI